MGLRRLVALLALALAVLTCACAPADEPSVVVAAWTLVVPGAAPTEVLLPAHLEGRLPERPSTYVLRADVELPPELRGHDLVLAVDRMRGGGELWIGERIAPPVRAALALGLRPPPQQAWYVRAEHTGVARVALELRIQHTGASSAWFDAAPRLSATRAGDAAWRRAAYLHDASARFALGALFSVVLTHLGAWAFDRRRLQNLWFGLQVLCATYYPLFQTGESRRLAGSLDTSFLGIAVGLSPIAGLCFTYAACNLGRPPRVLGWLAGVVVATAFVFRDPFTQRHSLTPVVVAVALGVILFHLAILVRVVRRPPRPANAVALLVGWTGVLVVVAFDAVTFTGSSGAFGGFRIGTLALVLGLLAESLILGRTLVRAVARGDDLNAELAGRVRALESQKREIEALNAELRRQIAERSRHILESLAKTVRSPGKASVGPGVVVDGRWRARRLLGVGGVGRVFEVERVPDGYLAALKVLSAPTDTAAMRFAREAELVAQIDDANVVRVLDVGVAEEGFLFLVMELVHGASLADARARWGDLPWARRVIAEVATGLAAIHARGIVHRDLKPQNVLLAEGEPPRAKITDFGVSGLVARPDATPAEEAPTVDLPSGDPTEREDLTRTGVILGTPRYMAPEVVDGAREATPASDVFALGVMAYEMLSGAPPFASPPAVARLAGAPLPAPPPPLGARCPTVAPALAALVDAALAFDPTRRPTAAQLRDAARD